jgi:hypothetical protein
VPDAALEDEEACAAASESRFLRAMFNSSTVGWGEGFSVAHGLFWKITFLRIPLIADTHSRLIADSVPGDRGHPGWGA